MPVIVVGADTPAGEAIARRLLEPGREVRVFVSDEDSAASFRQLGAKVALGDLSDDTHIEAAATRCFTAILITDALGDGRELAFTTSTATTLKRWASAVSKVQRVIWVHDGDTPDVAPDEVARVSPNDPDLVSKVADLDEARSL